MSDDAIFKALADSTRREILYLLTVTPQGMNFRNITTEFRMSRQAITKHLKILERSGLITMQPQGREMNCTANPSALQGALEWLRFFERYFVPED